MTQRGWGQPDTMAPKMSNIDSPIGKIYIDLRQRKKVEKNCSMHAQLKTLLPESIFCEVTRAHDDHHNRAEGKL